MPPKVAVYVGNSTYPPTEQFVSAIQKMLPDNFEGCHAHIVAGSERDQDSMLRDITGCVRYTMERAEKLMRERPDSALAASIIPLQVEFGKTSKRMSTQSMIFVAARNNRGNEWLYAHFVGKITAPVEVTYILADTVNQVLEERGSREVDPAEADFRRAVSFIELLTESVDFVLENGAKRPRLN